MRVKYTITELVLPFWCSLKELAKTHTNVTDLENVSSSLSLCFGLIESTQDFIFHYLLLISKHYMYTCGRRNKLRKLQVYIQLVMNSMKIENQIAFYNNDSNPLCAQKWSRFKINISRNVSH